MSFKHLGPLLGETRTQATCEICNNFIYKQIYLVPQSDDKAKTKEKVVFVCKNCLKNNNNNNNK